MLEIMMVCDLCDYDFGGVEQEIDSIDDDLCNDHYCCCTENCDGEDVHECGDLPPTKNVVFAEEIAKYKKTRYLSADNRKKQSYWANKLSTAKHKEIIHFMITCSPSCKRE